MTPLSPADVHTLAIVHQGAPLPEFRGKGYRGEDGAHGVARSTLESLMVRDLVELRLDGVWLITEEGARLLADTLVASALQGPAGVTVTPPTLDPLEQLAQLGLSSLLPEPPLGEHWWGAGGSCARCRARASLAMNTPCSWRPQPSITCPKCGSKSFNLRDIEERYCARCHSFHEDLAQSAARAARGPGWFPVYLDGRGGGEFAVLDRTLFLSASEDPRVVAAELAGVLALAGHADAVPPGQVIVCDAALVSEGARTVRVGYDPPEAVSPRAQALLVDTAPFLAKGRVPAVLQVQVDEKSAIVCALVIGTEPTDTEEG